MNKSEFIELIFSKKNIDKEIFNLSKEINDFPLAYSILNAICGQTDLLKSLLDPKLYGEIDISSGEIKRLCFNNNKLIKEEGLKFINQLEKLSKVNFKFKEKKELKNSPSENLTLGIDLGTTNTVISIAKGKDIQIIPLENGERMLPSVVSVNKNKKFDVGHIAQNQKILNTKDTFFSIKRFIGRRSNEMKKYVNDYPFEIDVKDEKVKIFSPKLNRNLESEEITAQILKKVKRDAEDFLKKEIKNCVITVPAYFDNNQRIATEKAAIIAGFKKVEHLFDEPTAAAFAYEVQQKESQNKTRNTIVCDLGGGTFDISLVKKIGKNVESMSVTATLGDRYLGGDDYTKLLVDKIKDLIIKENDQTQFNPSIDASIRSEVLKAKHFLSSCDEVDIQIPFLFTKKNQPFNFEYTLTRKFFESVTSSISRKIEKILKKFLNLKEVKNQTISKVITVGGASRMPVFRELIEVITGIKPQIDLNPDEIVAKGAALYAKFCSKVDSSKLIIGVVPISLGTTIWKNGVDGCFDVLIPSNTPIPVRKTKFYTTMEHFQEEINVDVYQGERIFSKDNILLGQFDFNGIQKAKKGKPSIKISFEIGSNGILRVYAIDSKTNSKKSITISNSINLTDEEIERLRRVADIMAEKDKTQFRKDKKLNDLSIYREISNDIKNPQKTTNDISQLMRIDEVLKIKECSIDEIERLIRYLKIFIISNNICNEVD